MNILSRGLKHIKRRKLKTIILFALVLVLASFATGAFLVANAINSTTTHLRRLIPLL